MGAPDTRVIFRTAGEKSPVEEDSFPPTKRAQFHYDPERCGLGMRRIARPFMACSHLYERVGNQA